MKRVLVIENNREVLWIIAKILEHAGFQAKGSNDPANAISTIIDFNPNLILLTVQLGKYDGRALCENLKQLPSTKDIPLIIMSTKSKANLISSYNCKPDDFIKKPFDMAQLIKKVNIQLR